MNSNRRLRAVDALWLNMETGDTPMHVAVLAIFEIPAAAEKVDVTASPSNLPSATTA